MSEPLQPQPASVQGNTPVHYAKSNYFRVIHVDGMYGGPAPALGNMTMTVFSFRTPLPERTMNDASGNEIVRERVVKQGIENELECSLVMNLATAKIMHKWLDDAIKKTEAIQQKLAR
ncbi:MAG: hypothetical protein ABSD57_03045 [Verrucomicrobiota bacterium]|jgi:hypothetical protein